MLYDGDTAVGCADVMPPPNVWWKRGGDGTNATFGCTGKSFPVHRMTCVGNDWHSDATTDSIDCPDSPLTGASPASRLSARGVFRGPCAWPHLEFFIRHSSLVFVIRVRNSTLSVLPAR